MRLPIVFALLAGTALPSAAQETTRYSLERTADGYVRMNNATGEMSICTERSGDLVCRDAVDASAPGAADAQRLAARVAELEKRVAALEGAPRTAGELPSEAEMESALSFMERFFRRFMGVVKDLEQDADGNDAPSAAPQKT